MSATGGQQGAASAQQIAAPAIETAAPSAVPPRPALIVMVGAPGSGKSYLAQIVASSIGAELVQTDAVRKELFPSPRYTPAEASAVYGACHQRIREALGQGKRVVFDGTNLRERRRLILYQIAERAGATLAIVAAYAPEAAIRARLEQRMRARTPGDASDADWRIYLRLRRDAEPIPRPHVVANTVAAPGPIVRLLRRQLQVPLTP